jgi:hypothetical protein
LASILETAFQKNLKNRGMAIENHDHIILMGDLNFRIENLSKKETITLIN